MRVKFLYLWSISMFAFCLISSSDDAFSLSGEELYISDLYIASGQPYKVESFGLEEGGQVYVDRAYTYSYVPSFLSGATVIRTANDDKFAEESTNFLRFQVNQPVTVYVLYGDRYEKLPSWLEAFQDTKRDVLIDESGRVNMMSIFAKDFSPGVVALGGNFSEERPGNYSMYTVAVLEHELKITNIFFSPEIDYELIPSGYPDTASSNYNPIGATIILPNINDDFEREKLFDLPKDSESNMPLHACMDLNYDGPWDSSKNTKKCGEPVASAWCKDKGYIRASDFSIRSLDWLSLITLGSREVLDEGYKCKSLCRYGFTSILCEPEEVFVSFSVNKPVTIYRKYGWGKVVAVDFPAGTITMKVANDRDNIAIVDKEFRVSNLLPRHYKVESFGLEEGGQVYVDRAYTYSYVPSFLSGATVIRTANDDKFAEESTNFLRFQVNQPVTVYVLYDDRHYIRPSWLTQFRDTGRDVQVDASTHTYSMSILTKEFPIGKITLGGNYPDHDVGNNSMYTVAVVPTDNPEPGVAPAYSYLHEARSELFARLSPPDSPPILEQHKPNPDMFSRGFGQIISTIKVRAAARLTNGFQFPPGLDLLQNVRIAQSMAAKPLDERLRWFYDQVRLGGPWDYKQLTKKTGVVFEDFGNFHYGVAGSAAEIPEWLLVRAAGFDQKRAGNSQPDWDVCCYGDDPVDQFFTQMGVEFYKKMTSSGRQVISIEPGNIMEPLWDMDNMSIADATIEFMGHEISGAAAMLLSPHDLADHLLNRVREVARDILLVFSASHQNLPPDLVSLADSAWSAQLSQLREQIAREIESGSRYKMYKWTDSPVALLYDQPWWSLSGSRLSFLKYQDARALVYRYSAFENIDLKLVDLSGKALEEIARIALNDETAKVTYTHYLTGIVISIVANSKKYPPKPSSGSSGRRNPQCAGNCGLIDGSGGGEDTFGRGGGNTGTYTGTGPVDRGY